MIETKTRHVIQLDVREDIMSGGDPFARIMKALSALRSDEDLSVVAPFEPLPLIHLLQARGFTHRSSRVGEDWEVTFFQGGGTAAAPANRSPFAVELPTSLGDVEVDARGLEPPQPMVRILEALATVPDGVGLCAKTDRRPMHLYAQLEARGFRGETLEQTDGSFLTRISRA